MALFVYVNTGGDQDLRERDLVGVDAAGFLIDMSCVLADRCSSSAPAASRDALQQLVRRVRQGDTVVVARLSYLGNGIADVVATLKALRLKRIRCVCLELGNTDLCATGDGTPLRVLQSVQGMEAEINRARGREASALAKRNGLPQGRPASLSAQQRSEALRELSAGKTVTQVARLLGTSRQTVLRIRDNATPEPQT